MSPLQRGIALAVAAVGVVILVVVGSRGDGSGGFADDDGYVDDDGRVADGGGRGDDGPAVESGAPAPALRFTRWSHPSGLFSTDVPEGWFIDGALGDAMDQGQFRINANSRDGRSHISFAHNWMSYMEYQHGPYRPGAATVETLVLPGFVQQQGASGSRVVYRSANRRITMPSQIGAPMPFDAGTLGFLMQRRDGGFSAGTVMGETMYIASPGTPGLWRLRLFAAAVSPADTRAQADARAAVTRLVEGLELSPQFHQLWNEGFRQTQQQMREYSAQMDRVFSRYLQSAARSSSRPGRDTADDWATMMRGGQYAENPETGEHYWVSNDRDSWWVNDRGTVVGSDTGAPPAVNENWKPLVPRGQAP